MCKKTNGQAWKPNPRQALFIAAFAGNAADAARQAGYASPHHAGSRLMANVHIAKRVAEGRADQERETIASANEVLEFYTEELRDGKTHTMKQHGAHMLAKYHGLLIDRTELSGYIGQFPDAVNRCNPEEKLAIADILRRHET